MAQAFVLQAALVEGLTEVEAQLGPNLKLPRGDYVVYAKADVLMAGQWFPTGGAPVQPWGKFRLVVGSAEDVGEVELVEWEAAPGIEDEIRETVMLTLATKLPSGGVAHMLASGHGGAVGEVRITAIQLDRVTVTNYVQPEPAHVGGPH